MDKILTCLVLGSSGLIGSNLVKRLKEEGHFVVGADIREPIYTKPDRFDLIDLTDFTSCDFLFKRCKNFDRVYQLAADMGGAGFIFTGNNDADLMFNSALINLNVAKNCVEWGIQKLFYSSSVCAYSIEQVKQKIKEKKIEIHEEKHEIENKSMANSIIEENHKSSKEILNSQVPLSSNERPIDS